MNLTASYRSAVPGDVLDRYSWLETRNAAAVLRASNPEEFDDLVAVLAGFQVYDDDLLRPGGNRGPISIRIDGMLEQKGWRAVRITLRTTLVGRAKRSSLHRGGYLDQFLDSQVESDGYEVDNMKRRVAADVEWNGKDGALDRDAGAYRALYDLGLIDVAVIITRDHEGIQRLVLDELRSADAARRLGTKTTTNMRKLRDRMTRGDTGGCPLLAVGITRATWAGAGVAAPPPTPAQEAFLHDELGGLDGP